MYEIKELLDILKNAGGDDYDTKQGFNGYLGQRPMEKTGRGKEEKGKGRKRKSEMISIFCQKKILDNSFGRAQWRTRPKFTGSQAFDKIKYKKLFDKQCRKYPENHSTNFVENFLLTL